MEVRKNTKRNIIFGLLNKIVTIILPFVLRTVVNVVLGIEYLGLNSLFSSVLVVLSLTEMGISSALVYNMYKPIAENDQVRINALLRLYKKSYFIIGIAISTIGMVLIPFLGVLVKGGYPKDINIYIIYIIQLFNTSLGYFLFAYKQSLLSAYQREDINAKVNMIVQGCLYITQIVVLYSTKNYYFYIICTPLFTIVNNLWINHITKRIFPESIPVGQLDTETKQSIKELVMGTFIQKICAVTRNSIDSICISAFLGLTLTGIYNNYYLIINALITVLSIINTSLTGGIGNHVVSKSVKENYDELSCLDFMYMVISGFCTICLIVLFQPFMKVWMGNKLLDFSSVLLFSLYFYMLKMGDIKSIYSGANGLWWKMRYRSICETFLNVVLNVLLGKLYGINGVIIATIIALFFCNFIWASKIVFDSYFKENYLKKYFVYHLKYFAVTFIIGGVVYFITDLVTIKNLFIEFVVKAIICVLVTLIFYLGFYWKKDIFKSSIKLIVGK